MLCENCIFWTSSQTAHHLSCSVFILYDCFKYWNVPIQYSSLFEESMPVALNYVNPRNNLTVSQLLIVKNSIIIFTVVIAFMTQIYAIRTNQLSIDISGYVGDLVVTRHRFFHSGVRGYLADNGRSRVLKFNRIPENPNVVWKLKRNRRKPYLFIQNDVTDRYICFNRKGKPILREKSNGKNCRLNIKYAVSNGRKVNFVLINGQREWSIQFCSNRRAFVYRRPNSPKCPSSKLTEKSKEFTKCHGSISRRCRRLCRSGHCDTRHCQKEYFCSPERMAVNMRPFLRGPR